MENRTALVLGGGGLGGAYGAGVAAGLDLEFDAYYGSSVGVFATTFHLTKQRETIENTWKNHVDGTKLVNFNNGPRRNGRHKLDLDYLIGTFQNGVSHLDLDAIFDKQGKQRKRLVYAVTDVETGLPFYVEPTRNNIFSYMKGSSALPFVNIPQLIDGRMVMDGDISDCLPVKKAIEDGYTRIVAVTNKEGNYSFRARLFWNVAGWLHAPRIRGAMHSREQQFQKMEDYLVQHFAQIKVIRPTKPLPLKSKLDTNRNRLVATFEMGRRDAQEFMGNFQNN